MNIYIPSSGFATQGPAPAGFHIPIYNEWSGVETIMKGLSLTTGDNWRIYLHLPFAGRRSYSSSDISNQGERGYYWSSSPYGSSYPEYARELYLESSRAMASDFLYRASGFSIRCFKDSFEKPTSSWTVIRGTLGSAGIFWNQTNGIISITSNGTTGYTIMDKNLGATTVYSNGDTLTQANMGNIYQWGNNYGFPSTGTISKTSSTRVDASKYGPSTTDGYYESDTFIKYEGDWSSVRNDNLRGGTDGNVNITTINELKNDYIGEKPYEGNELCFTANIANSTIQLIKNGSPTSVTLETSTNGRNWSTYTIGDTIILTDIGDKIYFRNTSTTDTGFSTNPSNSYQFVMTGSIAGSGDTNYLLNKNSTTTVSSYCYYRLFSQCTSLTTSPQLPATTLAENCYANMFYGCTKLITASALPATTLAYSCYSYMFKDCTGLTTVTTLPATTLTTSCYEAMFRGCTSLTIAPALPATKLSPFCYYCMFYGCTGLTIIPSLPATTLARECYRIMFKGCQKIKLSTTQTGEYQTAYRIPTTGTGATAYDALANMFNSTGGTFTGTPSTNTTYYTSNTVI